MDENEEEARYSSSFAANGNLVYDLPAQYTSHCLPSGNKENEYEDEAIPEDEYEENQNDDLDFIREESYDYDDDYEDDGDYEENRIGNGAHLRNRRFPKKRKLKSLIANYENPQIAHTSSKSPLESRTTPSEWTEHETTLLLDAWGEKFVQLGRKSLRSEGWHEVAEKVSRQANVDRTDTQCRNRLDTLKKRYKKQKSGRGKSRWIHFKKLDMLLSSSSPKQSGLSCGMDGGEFVFMNPDSANGLDKMRDSPGESDASEDGGRRRDHCKSSSFKVLANSLNSFSKVFEKIERSNRQHMKELEKMRMEFQRELELQKQLLLEKTRDEIRRLHQDDDDDSG